MNFRITTLLFALLLSTLWIFGLMISHRKRDVDQTAIVPSMQANEIKIDSITIKNNAAKDKEPESLEFVLVGDHWYLKDDKQQIRVEDHRIRDMIDSVKRARADESADLSKDLAHYGLAKPKLTVKLSGKDGDDRKDWTFNVGNESPEVPTPLFFYVNSSERPDKAFAVAQRPIKKLFVEDAAHLRSKRLFDFIESGVTGILIQKGDKKLEIKRGEGNTWLAVEPKNLGFLGFDSASAEEKEPEDPHNFKQPKKKKIEEPATGVKALLGTIVKVTVDKDEDFVPPGKPLSDYDLVDAKTAPMKIEISTTGDAKEPVKDTLLIGKKVPNRKETYYYARIASDDGVIMLPEKTIEPIEKALADPGKLRSLDVAVFDTKLIDFVFLRDRKEQIEFFFPPEPTKPWLMFMPAEKKGEKETIYESRNSNDTAVTALISHLAGKKMIVEYLDLPEKDKDKKLVEWELKPANAEIAIYAKAIDRPELKDEDLKKLTKEDQEKRPALKKEMKPTVKLEFGKVDKDVVYVRRTLDNGNESYFTAKKEFLDKIVPTEGIELAYVDKALPAFPFAGILSVKLQRKTDKETEVLEVEPRLMGATVAWYLRDASEPTGLKLAESKSLEELLIKLQNAKVEKWVKKLDEKDDLEKFGLKNPGLIVTMRVPKSSGDAASVVGVLASNANPVPFDALCGVAMRHQTEKGTETVVFEFGSEAFEEKEKEKGKGKEKEKIGTYAKHSGKDKFLFVIPNDVPKLVKTIDLRDRGFLMNTQARVIASLLGVAAGDSTGVLMLASPYVSGQVHQFDADKIKEIKLSIRTPFELRTFHFEKVGKDKDQKWTDKLSLPEFQVDSEKVTEFAKTFAKLGGDRIISIAGPPRAEQKLTPKDCTVLLELTNEDGSKVTLTVGTSFGPHGYYAHSTYWPDTVFMIPLTKIEPLLRGAGQFAKERLASN